jgi:hypothetical protein
MKTYTVTIENGTTTWHNSKGQLHREDGPAVEWANGTKMWYLNGEFHREDGPAVEYANGTKWWYRNGQRHREDGPAIEYADGTKEWYRNDQLHRKDGPAIEGFDGMKFWYLNGKHVTEADAMKLNQTIEIDGKKFTMTQLKALIAKAGA